MSTSEVAVLVAVIGVVSAAAGVLLGEALRGRNEREAWLRERRQAVYADVIRLASASKNASLDCLEMHGQATDAQKQAATEAALELDVACAAADVLAPQAIRVAMESLFNSVMALAHAVEDAALLNGDDPVAVLATAVRDAHRKFRETARGQFGVN